MLIMPGARSVYIVPNPLVNEITDRWLQLSRFAIFYMFMMLPTQFTLPQVCSVVDQL